MCRFSEKSEAYGHRNVLAAATAASRWSRTFATLVETLRWLRSGDSQVMGGRSRWGAGGHRERGTGRPVWISLPSFCQVQRGAQAPEADMRPTRGVPRLITSLVAPDNSTGRRA